MQTSAECWQVCLINYKRSGDKFWNQFYLAPVVDENNCVSHYMGIQSDVSELMNQNGLCETEGKLRILLASRRYSHTIHSLC